MAYRFLDDLTSDVMFEAQGKTLAEAFVGAAEAMFDVVCGTGIKAEKEIGIEVEAADEKELLHRWLSELLTESEIEHLFFGKFEVQVSEENGKFTLKGNVWGEGAEPGKGGTLVKAVTYYGLAVEKGPEGYIVRASLDI